MSARRWGCLALILVPIVAVFLLVKIPQWINNARLEGLRERVTDYPLPAQTEVAEYDDGDTAFGLLGGNSDHCDYRVRLTLQTTLADEEIHRYYDAARVPGVDGGGAALLQVWFADRAAGERGPRLFILEAFDSTSPGMDLRCH